MISLKKFIDKTDVRCHAVSGKPFFNIIFDFESLIVLNHHGDFYRYMNQLRAYKMREVIDPFKVLCISEVVYDVVENKNANCLNVELKRSSNIDIKLESSRAAKSILTNLYDHIIESLDAYPSYDDGVKINTEDM